MPRSKRSWFLDRIYDTIGGAGLFFGVIPSIDASLRKPPTTLLEKESYSAKIHRRKRRLKEIRTGFKRFLAFLFSQIGLSILVIGYTIFGGMLFRAVEYEHEQKMKITGKALRLQLADEFSNDILRELRYVISPQDSLSGKYYEPLPAVKKSNELDKHSKALKVNESLGIHQKRQARVKTDNNYTRTKCLKDIAELLQYKTRQELHNMLRKLVNKMKDTGWNGEDSMEDCKWSLEGAILFAVTVITTIGYGHAVPKTSIGQFLTIIYALVGIPLVFLYLTNIGDYLASLFRILYAKICRRCCEGSCLNNMDTRRRGSIFTALKAGTSDIDRPFRRDYLLDVSLHRNNVNIIRRIGTFRAGRDKSKILRKEDSLMNCVGANVFCNEHVFEMDRLEQQKKKTESEIKDKPLTEDHRMHFNASANSSRSFWLSNNSDVKQEKRSVSLGLPKPSSVISPPQFNLKSDLLTPPSNSHSVMVIQNEYADTPKHYYFPQSNNNPKAFNLRVSHVSGAPTQNTGTQTTLQAGPNDYLDYQSLCKSFITGHYLRSYRREMRHQRKQMRKKFQTLSLVSYCEPPDSVENKKILENNRKKPSDSDLVENIIPCSSLQDLKYQTPPGNSLVPTTSTSPALHANLELNHVNSGPQLKSTKSTFSLPGIAVQRKSKVSQTPSVWRRDIPVPLRQKSRLSVLSSLAGSSNDLAIRLSYYSDDIVSGANDERSQDHGGNNFDEEDISKVTVPISLSIMIVTTYILIGASVFCIWEDNNYLKWSYFCFVTLSTIGFGDIVPGTKVDSTNPKEKLIIITMYVAVGLSVFAMCIKLMQEEVVSKFKWLARYVRELKRKVRKHLVEPPPLLETTSVYDEEKVDEHCMEEMMDDDDDDDNDDDDEEEEEEDEVHLNCSMV